LNVSSSKKKPVYVLLLYKFFTSFGASLFAPFFSKYFIALGGTPFLLGIAGSVSSLMLSCLDFYGGYLTDKYGSWLVLGILLIVAHIFVALYSIAWSWEILFLLIILATSFSFYGSALNSLMASIFKPEERAVGYQLVEIVRRATRIFSPLVAGLLISTLGILTGVRIGTLVAGTLGIISGFMILLFMKDEQFIVQGSKDLSTSSKFIEAYIRLLKKHQQKVIFIIFLGSMILFTYSMVSPYLVLYAMDVAKLSGIEFGLILSLDNILVTFILLPLTGLMVKKVGEINSVIVSSFTLVLSMFMFTFQPCFFTILFSYILLETSFNLYRPAIFSYWTQNVEEFNRGKFYSLVSLIEGITIIAPLLGGKLYEVNSLFLFIAGILIGSLTMLVLVLFKLLRTK